MCIADMAAGRRTFYQQELIVPLTGSTYRIPADPRRLALVVSSRQSFGPFLLCTDPACSLPFASAPSWNTFAVPILRIEDYGQLIQSDVFALDTSGSTSSIVATSLLADYTLDKTIQQAV